jgi:flagellar hook-associated protein 2
MGTITSSIGLISGINTSQIIDSLMQIESQPVTLLQTRIASNTAQKSAFSDLMTSLQSLQTTGKSLEQATTYQAATATSSDPNVLTATAANGAAVGSYTLQVARLVTTQQMVSNGFTDFNSAPVGAGTISIELGGGELSSQTTLAQLNGGAGIPAGQFRITDRSGASTVIDTTGAVTIDDVIKKINTSLDVSVRATIQGDKIVLTDTSGKTTSNLTVQDLGSGTAAASLGLVGNVAGNTITGTDINYVSRNTLLNQLNDTRGIRRGTGGNDFTVTLSDGSTVGVNLATAKTVGDVLDAINTAGGGKLKADVVPGANGIRLTDSSGGGGSMSITQQNGSNAAQDLGLLKSPSGNVINGSDVLAGIDTTLLSSLRGGTGVSLGTVSFTNRSGASGTVNFAGANTTQDIIDRINNAGLGLQASLKSSGNGIQISDTSGGSGNIVIADTGGGQTATQLGIAGTFDNTKPTVQGADMDRQWVTSNTQLSTLNGGKGIAKGRISITNAKGASVTVDLSDPSVTTVGDVLYRINNAGLAGVTASINATGDGIVLNDASGGANKLKVNEVDTTTAADLNIKGTATATSIDGAYRKTITVGPNDTLATVQAAINNLGFGVTTQIINDGSGLAPYRLSLTAGNSGRAGRVVLDTGTTNLGTQTLVSAQDAAVFLGSADSAQPLLVTSSSNQITGVIQGVTMNLTGVSSGPVQLNVSNDPSNIVKMLGDFTTNFNSLVDKISSLTSYDTNTNTPGLLLGDPTVSQIQANMYDMLNSVVTAGGRFKTIGDIGITMTDGAKLQFDQDKFAAAFAQDPTALQQLFNVTTTTNNADGSTTTNKLGIAYSIDNQINQLIDPVNGTVTQENTTLDTEAQQFQDRIDQLNSLLADKRTRLEEQFANMESVLAGLQSQSAALGSITSISAPSSSSTKKSS